MIGHPLNNSPSQPHTLKNTHPLSSDGKTLVGRSLTIIKQYGPTLTKAIFNDIFRLNDKTVIYANIILMGRMVSLNLYVPFLITIVNDLPKCC